MKWTEIGDSPQLRDVQIEKVANKAKANKMKVCDIIKLIEKDGWYLVVTKGSHRQ